MRVLQLISSSGVYGAEKMVVGLCEALPRYGVEPTLVVFDNLHARNVEVADYALTFGIPVRLLPCAGRFDPRAVYRLRADIRATRADLVHVHGFKANLYGFLATRFGVPIVATNHRFDTGPQNRFDRPTLQRMDAVFAVSNEARDSLREVYGIGNATTIPNGVEPRDIVGATPTLDLPKPIVGMVARLAPEKAPEDFLALAAQIPDAQFVVVGDGPLRDALEASAGPNVTFLGFRDDIAGIYASLDVLVQPSLREGMPMTILEAMAAGVPVVATDVGAAADVIDNGRTGMLVPPRDVPAMAAAVKSLLRDDHGIGQAGAHEVAMHYTVDVMARRYAEEYQMLTTGRRSA